MKTASFGRPTMEIFVLPHAADSNLGPSQRSRSWIEAWVEWARRLRERRRRSAVTVRILSSEGIARTQLEQLRAAVCRSLPHATSANLYVWKWPQEPLLDVTFCLPLGACATATFSEELMVRAEGWSEIEGRLYELIQKCLEQSARL